MVRYWASRNESPSDMRSPTTSSVSDLVPKENSSRPSSSSPARSDEEVSFEYLRNVIMQFLEHKEMQVPLTLVRMSLTLTSRKPYLVCILSTILRFTPQETRRLASKVWTVPNLCIVFGVYTYNWKHASVVRRHGFKVPTITLNDEKLDITSWSPASYSSRFSPLHWFSARLGAAPS